MENLSLTYTQPGSAASITERSRFTFSNDIFEVEVTICHSRYAREDAVEEDAREEFAMLLEGYSEQQSFR
jgi:hypothetical protein